MRRILISKRGEFSYQDSQPDALGHALKRLGAFFDGVKEKEETKNDITISNSVLNSSARKSSLDQ